jgi:6-phosphofructokinase
MWDQRVTPSNYAIITVCDGSRIEEDKVLEYTPYLSPRSKSVVLRQMTIEKAKAIHAERGFTLEEVVETGSSLSGSGLVAVELLRHLTSQEVMLQPLTYLLRTSPPDGQDLLGAVNFAILATRLVKEGKFGRMVAYQQRYNLTDVDLNLVTQGVNTVEVDEMYDVANYRPKVSLIWAAQESRIKLF